MGVDVHWLRNATESARVCHVRDAVGDASVPNVWRTKKKLLSWGREEGGAIRFPRRGIGLRLFRYLLSYR